MLLAQTFRQRGVQHVLTLHRLDANQLDARFAKGEPRHLPDGEATPPGPTQGSQGEFHTRALSCSFVLHDHMSSNREAFLPLDPFVSRVFEQPGRWLSSEEAVQGGDSIQLLVVPDHALKIEPAID
jgi:hypothetical protein